MRAFIGLAGALCIVALAAQAEELSFEGPNAFRLPWAGLDTAEHAKFNYGRGLFHYHWDPLPSASGGERSLGPLYNADSCESCHIRDGRGLPPGATDGLGGLVLMLSAGGYEADGSSLLETHPSYGRQVQDQAIAPVVAELAVETAWVAAAIPNDPAAGKTLRRPQFRFTDPVHGPQALVVAPRMAPPMIGLGLLAAIPDATILAGADPDDVDGDTISGRANWVTASGETDLHLGRFGWKASVATVGEQVGHAATYDLGLTIPGIARPAGDCTPLQGECLAQAGKALVAADYDMDENSFRLLAFYAANLAVPPRRIVDVDATEHGEQLFTSAGCAACHSPIQTLASGNQIAPYTDLLLHDMGEGLADGFTIGMANGQEWRTPPLWGIGRTTEVSGGAFFLHDGRARGLEEAILWHGGEAISAQQNFRQMAPEERQALLTFLSSL